VPRAVTVKAFLLISPDANPQMPKRTKGEKSKKKIVFMMIIHSY
jgi:hypothetical protein